MKFFALTLAVLSTLLQAQEPGSIWLRQNNLFPFEWALDPDQDGLSNAQEYASGTDPFDSQSFLKIAIRREAENSVLFWNSTPGVVYQLLGRDRPGLPSDATQLLGPIRGNGMMIESTITDADRLRYFFTLQALEPTDADQDGLSSIDEGLLGTDPDDDDTDGDGRKDGDEIFVTLSDPLFFDPPGGTIRGTVFNDADNNGDLIGDAPLNAATVYLDRNFNRKLDPGERTAVTDASGNYEFLDVRPGLHHVRQSLPAPNVQTFPADLGSSSFNLLPDEVVEYVHAAPGEGNFDEPYGENASENPNIWGDIDSGPTAELVSPEVVLKPIGVRNRLPGLLTFNGSEFLSLPREASITLRFDEVIIDGPGADFLIYSAETGENTEEAAEIFVGPTADQLTSLGIFQQSLNIIQIDLDEFDFTAPVQFVKIVSQNNGGDWKGFELVGAECLNIARPDPGAYAVTITGEEVFEDRDFGRYFRDLPPTLVLTASDGVPGTTGIREGESLIVRATAFDDIAIDTITARANGSPLILDHSGRATLPATAGKIYFDATATDSAGQSVTKSVEIYVTNADGSLPFDPNITGQNDFAPEAPRTRILSPGPGFVSANDVELTAEIIGSPEATSWTLEYAPIDLVDPYDLTAEDSDYIELATGSGNIYSTSLGTLPLSTLPDGIYFVRLCAENSAVRVACYGQAVAKNVAEADLRPRVTIEGPQSGSDVMVSTEITGTITSSRPVTEWFVEFAPANQVDLNNINAPDSDWKRLAEGTGTLETSSVFASFDATSLKNNDYVVRVVANNDIGLGWAEPVVLSVCGEAKFGRNRLEFTDISIDLAGFPLQFTRVYDSLQSGEAGDLGFGWSMSLQDADIGETVPNTGVGGLFGSTPFRDGTRVYITAPTGERLGFTFKPEIGQGSALGTVYKATFRPDPGVYHQLAIPQGDQAFLSLNGDGTVGLFGFGFPYNPTTYVLTDPQKRRYTYHEDSGFLRAEDLNGNTITLNRDGIRHSAGTHIKFTRDPENRITKISAPEGMEWDFTYDSAGDLVTTTDPEGRTTTYHYLAEPAHYLESLSDPLGRTPFRYEYDPLDGRLLAIVDDKGNRREQSWDPAGFTGTVTSARGFATHLEYDARGNVTKETDPLGNVTTFIYGDPQNPDLETSVTDPAGETFTFNYDSRGNLTDLVPPIVSIRGFGALRVSYDDFGNILTLTGLDGAVSNYTYDTGGNLTSQRNAAGPHFDVERDEEGRIRKIIENPFYFTEFAYDQAGTPAAITDPVGYQTSFETNGLGLFDTITSTNGDATTFTYDSRGVPLTQTDPDGDSIDAVDNPDGSLTTTDRNGLTTTIEVDATGLTQQIIMPGGGIVTPVYDASNNLTSVTAPGGDVTSFTYDPEERLTSTTDAAGSTTTREYNSLGLLSAATTASGKRRTFGYDRNQRLVLENWHAPDDSIFRTFAYNYLFDGKLGSIVDTEGETIHTISFTGGSLQPGSVTLKYAGQTEFNLQYDWARQQAATDLAVTPGRVTLRRGFSPLNSIRAEKIGGRTYGLAWNSAGEYITMDRFPDGALKEMTFDFGFGNVQATSQYTYHRDGSIATLRHQDESGTLFDPKAELGYTRDAGGRLAISTSGAETATVSYDASGRLASVNYSDAALPDETYTYDMAGNRSTSHLTPVAATVIPGNRLTAIGDFTLTYDADGSLATRTNNVTNEVTRFSYDHRNRLILATVGDPIVTTVAYEYDVLDRVISRSINGVKTWIINDRNMPIGEFADGATEMSRTYLYTLDQTDDFHAVNIIGVGKRWFLKDELGSIRGLLDGNGDLVSWANYDSYGNNIGTPHADAALPGYAGRFFRAELGLFENRRRLYDPLLGRFTQKDPLGFTAGDTNLYAYVGNNPLLYTDPSGTTAAITYGELISMTSQYIDSLCKLGNCVGNLWKGVVEGYVNKNPVNPTGDPSSCAASFLPSDPCAVGMASGAQIANTLSTFGSTTGNNFGDFGGPALSIIGAVDSCIKMSFTLDGKMPPPCPF